MCPDPQLLSIYLDGELPSPWKEKMETHLAQCSGCKEKLESFRRLFEEDAFHEREQLETAREKVWQNLESMRRFHHHSLWRRRISVPLPAAAAAAVILALLTALWLRGGPGRTGGFVQTPESAARASLIFAAEDEMPGIIPTADMNGVLQYLGSDGSDILILRLPESRNFLRSGEPVIRAADYTAADYTRRQP